MANSTPNIIGYSAGGFIFQIFGAPLLFLFNGISYLISGISELFIKVKDNKVIDCGDRELIYNLNTLPYPDFSDYDFSNYRDSSRLPVMSSRGCLNRCIFCNEKPYWRKYRFLKAGRVFAEIKEQLLKYPFIDWIDFQDSLINGNIMELERLADLIIEDNLKIRWSGQAAIRKELTYDLLRKLKKSGCICLAYGLETLSSSLMLNTGKILSRGADPEQIVRDGNRAGLPCAYNFMFGLPGEDVSSAKRTTKFALSLGTDTAQFSIATPYPGTRFHELATQEGWLAGGEFAMFDGGCRH